MSAHSTLPDAHCAKTLLTDDEIRSFLVDGYLILDSGVAPEIHATVYRKLQWILHEEGNPGNNILPAVPEMHLVLDSPRIQGALHSVLGPGYVLHPHRFVHNNEPGERTAEGERMGKGSHSFIGWHQDSHSPLARPRHHYTRYAMVLYYPQDTPIAMGPTQLIPATHLNRGLSEADYVRGFQAAGPAGTCVLIHFDIAHGGSLNIDDHTRHMAKFVFARTQEPTVPSWNCHDTEWTTPESHHAPFDSTVVWTHHWNWITGRKPDDSSLRKHTEPASVPVPALIAALNDADPASRIAAMQSLAMLGRDASDAVPALLQAFESEEPVRQNTIYTLAAIGAPAVGPLAADLARRTENGWNEGAVPMEDSAYALAALGTPAIPALIDLLSQKCEWVRINALFALGEMGATARPAWPKVVAALRDPAHPVVRTALDAVGQIGGGVSLALPEIRRLLTESNPDWQQPLYRKWTGENQVRFNAVMALMRLGDTSEPTISLIAVALNDPCGYVGGFGVEYLLQHRTPAAMDAAVAFLRTRRWDDSLNRGIRTY